MLFSSRPLTLLLMTFICTILLACLNVYELGGILTPSSEVANKVVEGTSEEGLVQ